MSRTVSLGCLQIDFTGERLTPQQMLDLQSRKTADVMNFCHPLRVLQHSTFESSIYSVDGQVTLEFFLNESCYYALPQEYLPVVQDDLKIPRKDPFESELDNVLDALEMAPTHLILALSPSVNRATLRAYAPRAAQLRELRRVASGLSGTTPMLPGFNGPTTLNIPRVPKYLPTGSRVQISANVKGISPGEACLEKIQVLQQDAVEASSLPATMTLVRRIHGPGVVHSMEILEAHDHGHRLHFEVVVVDDWVDGSPRKLDLLRVIALVH